MAVFSQKGKPLPPEDVEVCHCKDGKDRWRKADNKTWVRVETFYEGNATIHLAYKSSRKWHNRVFEVRFEWIASEPLSEERAEQIAQNILEEYDDALNFLKEPSVIGFEQTEVEKVSEDDIDRIKELQENDPAITDSSVKDLKGWGESE